MVEVVLRYFPELSQKQVDQFTKLKTIYQDWNSRINVISRKDINNFYIHHVLHSLAIAKFITFSPGTRVLDVGTGGGFPGIPLAIMFPAAGFTLLDSIEKKIRVVSSVSYQVGLNNVNTLRKRAEEEKTRYDFVVSRAVSEIPEFVKLTGKNIGTVSRNNRPNGIIYLKGGDTGVELAPYHDRAVIVDIKDYFVEPFFETKKIVYLPFPILPFSPSPDGC
jgi:16S rRNA (guanine527-N7)-methyltransferase